MHYLWCVLLIQGLIGHKPALCLVFETLGSIWYILAGLLTVRKSRDRLYYSVIGTTVVIGSTVVPAKVQPI